MQTGEPKSQDAWHNVDPKRPTEGQAAERQSGREMKPSLLPAPLTQQEMRELGMKSNMAAVEASKWMLRLPVEFGFSLATLHLFRGHDFISNSQGSN